MKNPPREVITSAFFAADLDVDSWLKYPISRYEEREVNSQKTKRTIKSAEKTIPSIDPMNTNKDA